MFTLKFLELKIKGTSEAQIIYRDPQGPAINCVNENSVFVKSKSGLNNG